MKRGWRVDARITLLVVALIGLPGAALASEDPVVAAARQGDTGTLRALIEAGTDVNAAAADGMTALHWAAERRDVEMVEMLLAAGADVTAGTRIGGYVPLHVASASGSAAIVRLLLEAGSDPQVATSNSGARPIHLAAAAGNPHAIAALVEHGADVDVREGAWGQTPLIFAAAENRALAIRALLEAGADPALTGQVMDVPAAAAVDERANELLAEILDDLREAEGGDGTWEPTPSQVRAAIMASREVQRNPDVVSDVEREALGSGAPETSEEAEEAEEEEEQEATYAELVGTWGGLTPLLHAARQGHLESALALVEGGADINQVSAGDHTSPLLMATLNGHFDLALLLLERGADPNLRSDAGAAPLYAALEREWAPRAGYAHPLNHHEQKATYLELMERLLLAGADPNARLQKHLWFLQYTFNTLRLKHDGATPFWRAAYATDVKAMKLLVAHGADPHVPTLRVPEREGGYGTAADTIDHSGIPPVPIGGPGMYPIHAASGVGYGHTEAANSHRHVPDGWLPAVRYLVEQHGADVNARDHYGYTPLHHAAARGDDEMIRYLVERGADVTVVSRRGQTTVDMANGPIRSIRPFQETVELLESLGALNNHDCRSC